MYAIIYPGMVLGEGFIRALFSNGGYFPAIPKTLSGKKKRPLSIKVTFSASGLASDCCYIGWPVDLIPAGTKVVWIEVGTLNAVKPLGSPPAGALVVSLEELLSSPEKIIPRIFKFFSLDPDREYIDKVISARAGALLKALSGLCRPKSF